MAGELAALVHILAPSCRLVELKAGWTSALEAAHQVDALQQSASMRAISALVPI